MQRFLCTVNTHTEKIENNAIYLEHDFEFGMFCQLNRKTMQMISTLHAHSEIRRNNKRIEINLKRENNIRNNIVNIDN